MNVRDLIIELLNYNLDATVSILGLYDESEDIFFSWCGGDSCSVIDSKKECCHLFLETNCRTEETEGME